MDILLAILEAFLGIDLREKKPPPRRRVRPAGETGTARPASGSAAPGRRAEPVAPPAPARRTEPVEPSAEEVWRHFFGIPEEEEAARPVQVSTPVAPAPTPTPVRPQPVAAPVAPIIGPRESALSPVASLANGLRGNPTAARDAFVYAEIFGPPLADR